MKSDEKFRLVESGRKIRDFFFIKADVGFGKTALIEELNKKYQKKAIIIKIPFFHEITRVNQLYNVISRRLFHEIDFTGEEVIGMIDKNLPLNMNIIPDEYRLAQQQIETIIRMFGVVEPIAEILHALIYSVRSEKEFKKHDIAFRYLIGETVTDEEKQYLHLPRECNIRHESDVRTYLPILCDLVTKVRQKPIIILIDNLDIFFDRLSRSRIRALQKSLTVFITVAPVYFIIAGSSSFWNSMKEFWESEDGIKRIFDTDKETLINSIVKLPRNIDSESFSELLTYIMALVMYVNRNKINKDMTLKKAYNSSKKFTENFFNQFRLLPIGYALRIWMSCLINAVTTLKEGWEKNKKINAFKDMVGQLVVQEIKSADKLLRVQNNINSLMLALTRGSSDRNILYVQDESKIYSEIYEGCLNGLENLLEKQFKNVIRRNKNINSDLTSVYFLTDVGLVVPYANPKLRKNFFSFLAKEYPDLPIFILQLIETKLSSSIINWFVYKTSKVPQIYILTVSEHELFVWYMIGKGIDSYEESLIIEDINELVFLHDNYDQSEYVPPVNSYTDDSFVISSSFKKQLMLEKDDFVIFNKNDLEPLTRITELLRLFSDLGVNVASHLSNEEGVCRIIRLLCLSKLSDELALLKGHKKGNNDLIAPTFAIVRLDPSINADKNLLKIISAYDKKFVNLLSLKDYEVLSLLNYGVLWRLISVFEEIFLLGSLAMIPGSLSLVLEIICFSNENILRLLSNESRITRKTWLSVKNLYKAKTFNDYERTNEFRLLVNIFNDLGIDIIETQLDR